MLTVIHEEKGLKTSAVEINVIKVNCFCSTRLLTYIIITLYHVPMRTAHDSCSEQTALGMYRKQSNYGPGSSLGVVCISDCS